LSVAQGPCRGSTSVCLRSGAARVARRIEHCFAHICAQERMRSEKAAREEEALTFKPAIKSLPGVRPRLTLKHPEVYLAQVALSRRELEAKSTERAKRREVSRWVMDSYVGKIPSCSMSPALYIAWTPMDSCDARRRSTVLIPCTRMAKDTTVPISKVLFDVTCVFSRSPTV
jgi:hypothetical protein